MLNVLQLNQINKDDVVESFKNQIGTMNSHVFEKLKKTLNKKGIFDDVYKSKLQKL